MNKAYFKQSLKDSFKSTLYMTIIGILIYPGIILLTDRKYFNAHNQYIIYLIVLSFIVPITKNCFLNSKVKIDYYYSLPIKRITFMNINLLVGAIQLFVSYTISYLVGILAYTTTKLEINYQYFLPLYFVMLVIMLVFYVFNTFTFSRGNKTIDGILIMLLYSVVFPVIILLIEKVINSKITLNFSQTSYSAFFSTYLYFVNKLDASNINAAVVNHRIYHDVLFALAHGIIGYVLLYLTTIKDKAERAEQISTSWFGYRVLIPLFFVSFLDFKESFWVLNIFVCISAIIGYVIYYRTFKFPKKVFLILGIGLILGLIITIF